MILQRVKESSVLKLIFISCLFCLVPLLAAETKVLAFAGSTRKDSFNKQLVQQAASIAREMGANVTVIDLKDYPMPFYVALGNHDVRFFDTWMDATGATEAWLAAFQGTESLPTPYYSVEHGGFLMIILNATGGATEGSHEIIVHD